MIDEGKLDNPSNYTKRRKWFERDQYANILRDIVSSQLTQVKLEKDRIKKTRISQNIGYLIQVINSLINSEKDIEGRLEKLEEIAGIAQKGKIAK